MLNLHSRWVFLALFLVLIALLLSASYFQFVLGYEPCPLCIMQRLAFLFIALLALLVVIHNPGLVGRRIYSGWMVFFSLFGIYFSGKQVWLQNLPPDQVPACGPGLNILLQNFPINTILHELFFGSGQCAEVDWKFLGLSFAGWALVGFICCLVFAMVQFVKKA